MAKRTWARAVPCVVLLIAFAALWTVYPPALTDPAASAQQKPLPTTTSTIGSHEAALPDQPRTSVALHGLFITVDASGRRLPGVKALRDPMDLDSIAGVSDASGCWRMPKRNVST